MQFRLLVSASLFLTLVSPVVADGPGAGSPTDNLGINPDDIRQPADNAIPFAPRRSVVTKKPHVSRPIGEESRLMVKFTDQSKMRPSNGEMRPAAGIPVGGVGELAAIVDEYGLAFSSMFEQSFDELRALEEKAARHSGYAQPDLAGMVYVEGPDEQLEEIANKLNELSIVEFAHFDTKPVDHGGSSMMSSDAIQTLRSNLQKQIGGGGSNVPNFTSQTGWHRFYNDLNDNGEFDVPPFTPFYFAPEFTGGLHTPTAWALGEFLELEGIMDESWDPDDNPGRGATIRVGVVEGSAAVDPVRGVHVDLAHCILEPGQVLMPPEIEENNHGTATLGIIGAMDHGIEGPDLNTEGDDGEIGIIGLVPDAELWFFPTVSASHPGGRLQSAMISAGGRFEPGDVLSFSIGFPATGPLPTNPGIAILLRLLSDAGISTVCSAGNDCLNLDDSPFGAFDTGTIIVGAGMPVVGARPDLAPYSRLGFSNHYFEGGDDSLNVCHVQAWGAGVFTLGYGDAYSDADGQMTRYAGSFGGTSAAAPMIAGMVASLQGLSKAFFGVPLQPEQIRGVVQNGFMQEGTIDPFISGTEDPPDGDPCNVGDLIPGPDDPDPDLIGGFPEWTPVFQALFTGDWFDPSILFDGVIIRGTRVFGNINSLRAADNNPMLVTADNGDSIGGQGGNGFPAPVYFFRGGMTDIGVRALSVSGPDAPGAFITYVIATDMAGLPLYGGEAFNHDTGRWDWLLLSTNGGAAYTSSTFPITRAHADDQGFYYLRAWVYEAGLGVGTFNTAYDQIQVREGGIGSGGGGGGLGGG